MSYLGIPTWYQDLSSFVIENSSNVRAGGKQQARAEPAPVAIAGAREDVPKAQRFIPRARHDCLPVRRHGEVQDAVRVPRQRRDLCHRRVAPHNDLVERVAVRRYDLVDVFRPRQVAHLRVRVDAVQRGARQRVPEADFAIRSTPP